MLKKEEMLELGKFFVNGLAYDGKDPVKNYILKDKSSIVQKTKAKASLMKCLSVAKKMKAKRASRDDMMRLVTYAYLLLETDEYTMDLDKARKDLGIEQLEKKYAA